MSTFADPAPAHELVRQIRAGEVSSVALVDAALQRFRAVQPHLNPIVALDAERALELARTADAEARAGRFRGPLHGLPMTVKDCFEVAGLPAANGSADLRGHRPVRNAPAVQRLIDAGALVIGKSAVPLYSLDLQTFSDAFGVTRNPWNPDRTPGGSSGGAAVALATGITPLEIGTDLAGSVRIPAHATGVCSLKPSFGVVPAGGVLAPGPGRRRTADLSVAGPLARNIADLELLLAVIAGPAGREAAAWRLELPTARRAPWRIAAWLDDESCPVQPSVAGRLDAACRALVSDGVEIDFGARPRIDAQESFRDFCQLLYGEMSGGFPDAVYRSFVLAARRPTSAPWGPLAAMPGAVTQSHRDWLLACERREQRREAWDEFFTRFDVVLAPVSPVTALPHDHRPFEERRITLSGREYDYMQQAFWCALATVAYLPAAVVPVGVADDGLPVGLQVIAPYLGDVTALSVARHIERVCGGFRTPPSLTGRAGS